MENFNDSKALAIEIAKILDKKKAHDVRVLKVESLPFYGRNRGGNPTMQLTGQDQILSSACAMSAMRSSLLSRPQLMRTSSAGTPAAFSCSSFI